MGFLKLAVLLVLISIAAVNLTAADHDRLWPMEKVGQANTDQPNQISQRGFTSAVNKPIGPDRNEAKPWQLPSQALSAEAPLNINILVLRFNFQYETEDDPNTTGRGHMNFGVIPINDTIAEAAYIDSIGHLIDPPPHDSVYFDAHMRALNRYWGAVSENSLELTWDIYPPVKDSVYQLPREMAYYGRCDSVIIGLEHYFEDCIRLADTVHLLDSNHPDIDFTRYDAIILFHAGSDRQNDIGFPETCSDLFTGFIRFGAPIAVDGGTGRVGTALMMPETSSQDNRATALNAVLAHEFGHQLGLVDLYNTSNFLSQLGDFALMDNNGFGTGIDFGFPVGRTFGAIPLYPMAWSRAFLGFVQVHDFRQGTDIRIVAAEVANSNEIKIARIPISETQYYLIENRQEEIDQLVTNSLADFETNVIQGPYEAASEQFTNEYDFLMPGSGLAIFLIDEAVAAGDFDGDGLNNFDDNQLQLDKDRKFITLMEADGIVNFGGNYRSGFGKAEDLFRDDRATKFSPLTNPPAVDNQGNDTRIFIGGITRETFIPPGSSVPAFIDTLMTFDLLTDKRAGVFPIRATIPAFGMSPIAADLDGDGNEEVLIASGKVLSVVTSQGVPFLDCDTCADYTDSINSQVNARSETVPNFYDVPILITAAPVTGELSGIPSFGNLIALGHTTDSSFSAGEVVLLRTDNVTTGGAGSRADEARGSIVTDGVPIALSFGDMLYILTDNGWIYRVDDMNDDTTTQFKLNDQRYLGLARDGANLIVIGEGVDSTTTLYYISDAIYYYDLVNKYTYGPVLVDLNRDTVPELIMFAEDGEAIIISIDNRSGKPVFSEYLNIETGYTITANPIIGDVDNDNRPDIIIGGVGEMYAFDEFLLLKSGFPVQVSERFTDDIVLAAPVLGDIDHDGQADMVYPSLSGSIHAHGLSELTGFPLSDPVWNELLGGSTVGSPVLFNAANGGKLGYLSADGWFYAYEIDLDTTVSHWRMAGQNPAGTFSYDVDLLGSPAVADEKFPSARFYAWPNPVLDGEANIRYFLGEEANSVSLTLYDLSGLEIATLTGTGRGGVDNEVLWNCSSITPGIYRCMIEVEFSSGSVHDFTDIAVIR